MSPSADNLAPALADVAVVVAVKGLAQAKSRLAGELPDREGLVLAMFADTVDAVRAAGVPTIVVVSTDPDVVSWARDHGLHHISDPNRDSSLNAAFGLGADYLRARPDAPTSIALLQADIPALTPAEFRAAVDAAVGHRRAIVADRSSTGTTVLIRDADIDEPSAFGRDSAAAHRAAGATDLDPRGTTWLGLATDVDTVDDLDAAATLGVGVHTTAWLKAWRSAIPAARDAS